MRATGTSVPYRPFMTANSRSMACAEGNSLATGPGLARPASPLSVEDLKREPAPFALGEASPSEAGDLG